MAHTKLLGHRLQVINHPSKGMTVDTEPRSGLVFNHHGEIIACGKESDLPDADKVYDYGNAFLMPGFIDTHIHFPQIDIIGAYSGELLSWLQDHAFPQEVAIVGDRSFAEDAARAFSRSLYRNGSSTAMVFSSSKGSSCDILFKEFNRSGGRLISGKTSMDRGAPEAILDTLEHDLVEQERLIHAWHGKNNRIFYALTPRFAPSCSDPLMEGLAQLHRNFEGLYLQTHISENLDELELVRSIYPSAKNYLDVYDRFGMVHPKTVLAHGIHLRSEELRDIQNLGATISHCPTSNLFLGSGLFPFQAFQNQGLKITLGTDIGAGTSFSLWQTMADAVKVSKLRREQVSPQHLVYAATQGAADALGLGNTIGSLQTGMKADVQVLNPQRKELLQRRLNRCESEEQLLSALIFLADDRITEALWVDGKLVWDGGDSDRS